MLHQRQLTLVNMSSSLINATHVVVTIIHNESHRLPYFLRFYREMGFNHFIFIDNDSQDTPSDVLSNQKNCTVFSAKGSFKKSRFGMDWVNLILREYCGGKWVLHVDADEFLCFPQSIGNQIVNLTDYLELKGDNSMNCLLLDFYSKNSARHNHCDVGQNPFEVLKYYDAVGYMTEEHVNVQTKWIKGGVRGRAYFNNREWEGPALNKTPLVKWDKSFAFIKSAHQLWPFYLNAGSTGEGRITGALLHAKFLADFIGRIKAEQTRRQHSEEYDAYIDSVDKEHVGEFYGERSRLFVDWQSLVRDGLMSDPLCNIGGEHLAENPFQIRVI